MTFITETSKEIKRLLKTSNCILIVGRPGSGKSAILHHVASTITEENNSEKNEIVSAVIEPSDILDHYNELSDQIFVLDDFCGKNKINDKLLDTWKWDIENISKITNRNACDESDITQGNVKQVKYKKPRILISCNPSVFTNSIFETLIKYLHPCIFKLPTVPLSIEERINMIKNYNSDVEVTDIMLHENKNKENVDFRLLCTLSKGKDKTKIHQLFTDPLKTIKDELKNIKDNNDVLFCAISLCTIFNNKFKTKWLHLENMSHEPIIMEAISDMCDEFNLDYKSNDVRRRLRDQFDLNHNDWFSTSEDTYHLIHEEIFNIASISCGESYMKCFISHAPSSFIAERFNLGEPMEGLISITKNSHTKYFDRLMRDLSYGNMSSTFQNSQLTNGDYRENLIKYFKIREIRFKKNLATLRDISNGRSVKVPLIYCTWPGYKDLVKFLHEMECNLNEVDTFGRSALFVASAKGHSDIVKYLLENKASTDLRDKLRRSPLHIACGEGHTTAVQYLIDAGADIYASDKDGNSPLLMACASGCTGIVKVLLEVDTRIKVTDNKGDIYQADFNDRSALLIACEKGHDEIVDLLIQSGKRDLINNRDWNDRSPFYVACSEGRTKIVQMLFKNNADIHKPNEKEKSPLHVACERGHTEIVQYLIQIGAKTDARDKYKNLPLHSACKRGNLEVVKALQPGNDLCKSNQWNETPLQIAEMHEDVSTYLKELSTKMKKK